MNDKHLKCAFTLAEVLITLGIIGVVAAMTIPTLVANYQKKVYVSQLQKTVATISNAAKLLMAQEQTFNLNQTYLREEDGGNEAFENSVGRFLKTYFKVVKTCTQWDNINECISDEYKSLKGLNSALYTGSYCGILNNGAVICLSPFNNTFPLLISIDVNGTAGPNVLGRDAFNLSMNHNGTIAESFDKQAFAIDAHKPEKCGTGMYDQGCYNKIVQDGWKMDY